jgi:hypothetical protein
MPTDISRKSVALQDKVFRESYYISIYNVVLKENSMTSDSINRHEHADTKLIKMWNDFWILLPDSSSIRRVPFFELCDLCEEIFG